MTSGSGNTSMTQRPLVRVTNADATTRALLCEWLTAAGYRVDNGIDADTSGAADRATVAIVDVPYTRTGAADIIQTVMRQHPDEPILALSATFLSSVSCSGGCAQRLGVAGVLPKPVSRETLLAAVARFAARATSRGA
jgi:DNA-binding response OmpR family regulator